MMNMKRKDGTDAICETLSRSSINETLQEVSKTLSCTCYAQLFVTCKLYRSMEIHLSTSKFCLI